MDELEDAQLGPDADLDEELLAETKDGPRPTSTGGSGGDEIPMESVSF